MAASSKRSPRKAKAASGSKSAVGKGGAGGPTVPTTQPTPEAGAVDAANATNAAHAAHAAHAAKASDTTPLTKGTTEQPLPPAGSAQHLRKNTYGENGRDGPEKKRKMTISDVETVQNLIEKCLQLYLTKDEVISVLREQATIDAEFTKLIWGRLEGENPQFFKCYNTRLKLKAQIQMFNHLLTEQAAVVRRMQEGWNMFPNSSATASGIPLFQSGGNFGFDDQGLKVEQMEIGGGHKQMGMKKTWSLSDFGLTDGGKESGSPWQ